MSIGQFYDILRIILTFDENLINIGIILNAHGCDSPSVEAKGIL